MASSFLKSIAAKAVPDKPTSSPKSNSAISAFILGIETNRKRAAELKAHKGPLEEFVGKRSDWFSYNKQDGKLYLKFGFAPVNLGTDAKPLKFVPVDDADEIIAHLDSAEDAAKNDKEFQSRIEAARLRRKKA